MGERWMDKGIKLMHVYIILYVLSNYPQLEDIKIIELICTKSLMKVTCSPYTVISTPEILH